MEIGLEYRGGLKIKIIVKKSELVDKILYNLFFNPNSYIYNKFNTVNEKYKKTLILSSFILIDDFELTEIKKIDMGFNKETCSKIYNEAINTEYIAMPYKLPLDQWKNFFKLSLKDMELIYKEIAECEIVIRICMSTELPPPPIGQILRVDHFNEQLNISMILGYTEFDKRKKLEYPLTRDWFRRGVEISLLKYLFPFERLQKEFMKLTDGKYSEEFTKNYSNLLWYIQNRLFDSGFSLKKGVTQTIDFILELNKLDTYYWGSWNTGDLNLNNIERNILLLVLRLLESLEEVNGK